MINNKHLYILFPAFIFSVYAVIVAIIPKTFILHKILADRLNYFLMAREIAISGSHITSIAQNSPPINYAYGISYIYALPFKLSDLFESQLFGVQIINLCMMIGYSALALRYVISRHPNVPVALIALTIAISLLFDSHWQLSVLTPNADMLPALITVTCFIFFQRKYFPAVSNEKKMVVAIAVGGLGSLVKMSLMSIPVAIFLERFVSKLSIRNGVIASACVLCLAFAFLFIISTRVFVEYIDAMTKGYIFPSGEATLLGFFSTAINSVTNLIFSALPDRIIPNFRHFFVESYYINTFNPKLISPNVIFGMLLGFGVSAVTALGSLTLWRSSKVEIITLLLCLPFFMIVTNSTSRYLMAFQPLILAAFIAGISKLRTRFPKIKFTSTNILFAISLILLTQLNSLSLRTRGNIDLFTRIDEIGRLYGDMLNYLRSRDESATVGIQHFKVNQYSTMMWRAATDIPFYTPDSGLPTLVKERRVLAIVTCVSPDCIDFSKARQDTFAQIEKYGKYKFRIVYAKKLPIAQGEIYEVTSDQTD